MPSAPEFLAYDEGLISACENVLEKYWRKGKGLKIDRKPKGGMIGTFYCLIDRYQTKGTLVETRANEKLHLPVAAIHPFIVPDSFYFGLRLRFDHMYESTFAMTSVSVSIFAGKELAPIVRAEWDRRDIGSSRHAQPHWHLLGLDFLDKPNDSFGATGSADEKPKEFSTAKVAARTEIERIHFATNAAWQSGSPTTVQHPFLEKAQLINWLGGLAEYMSEQLTLVASKGPAPVTNEPAIADFMPAQGR